MQNWLVAVGFAQVSADRSGVRLRHVIMVQVLLVLCGFFSPDFKTMSEMLQPLLRIGGSRFRSLRNIQPTAGEILIIHAS